VCEREREREREHTYTKTTVCVCVCVCVCARARACVCTTYDKTTAYLDAQQQHQLLMIGGGIGGAIMLPTAHAGNMRAGMPGMPGMHHFAYIVV
jgi:hypothetical protein